MALKEVADQSMTLVISDENPVGANVQGIITKIGTASTKVKTDGDGIVRDGYQVQVATITAPGGGATIADPGPYVKGLESTAQYVKDDGVLVCRKDDVTGIYSATPQIPGSPPTNYPVTFKVKIQDAGQSKVKAE